MITSPQNEKLKLIRRLGRRRSREREGLFVAEGEDLLAAARDAGAEPVELLTAAGEGLGGTEVEPALLADVSKLGSGTRAIGVWREAWAEAPVAPCVYLHGVSDPGNVGTVIRTANALVGGSVVLGPDCADPYGAHAVRASMGAVFAQPLLRGRDRRDPRTTGRAGGARRRAARSARRRRDALPRRGARGAAGRGVGELRRQGDDPRA